MGQGAQRAADAPQRLSPAQSRFLSDPSRVRIAVVGGGVTGLCTALALVRRGAAVILYDGGATGESASAVAAGMLAPAFEAVLDPLSSGRFQLLRTARDLWPELMSSLGRPEALQRNGAMRVAFAEDGAQLDPLLRQLRSVGAEAERLDALATRKLSGARADAQVSAVFTPEDWRLDPRQVLDLLTQAFVREGGVLQRARVSTGPDGRLSAAGAALSVDVAILAAGADGAELVAAAPEFATLTPIKGQLLSFATLSAAGPIVRTTAGYLVPQNDRLICGATMEEGVSNRMVQSARLDPFRTEAVRLYPELAKAPAQGFAAVRASTPDGLPLAGPSSRSGVYLATGMRRNGWLLAPLVAEVIAAHVAGEATGPYAALFRPDRFSKAGPA